MNNGLKYFLMPLIAASCIIFIWLLSQPYLDKLDERANQDFATKATALEIEGKKEDFFIQNFGQPDRIMTTPESKLLLYAPGPMLMLWRSECLVRIEGGLVTQWQVNSD
jgi:hypothetical protein